MKSCKTCAFEETRSVECRARACPCAVPACLRACVPACWKCEDYSEWCPIGCIRVKNFVEEQDFGKVLVM
jgi:hypothetical protein